MLSVTTKQSIVGTTGVTEFNITPNSLSFTKAANMGNLNASITIATTFETAQRWIQNGIGSDLSIRAGSSEMVVWDGFINTLDVRYGTVSWKLGPITETFNDVDVDYQTVRYDTNPPIGGNKRVSDSVEDTISKARFGINHKTFSGGEGTDSDMEDLRDTILDVYAYPDVGGTFNLSTTAPLAMITMSCLGYSHYMSLFNYATTATTEANVSSVIEDAFSAEPNGLFFLFNLIEENTTQVRELVNSLSENTTGLSFVKAMSAIGNGGTRYLYGVSTRRQPYYRAVAPEPRYLLKATDSKYIRFSNNERVDPWLVEPGYYAKIYDVPRLSNGSYRSDPALIFIEQMTYTMPYGLTIQGGKNSRVDQKLATLGLGGI